MVRNYAVALFAALLLVTLVLPAAPASAGATAGLIAVDTGDLLAARRPDTSTASGLHIEYNTIGGTTDPLSPRFDRDHWGAFQDECYDSEPQPIYPTGLAWQMEYWCLAPPDYYENQGLVPYQGGLAIRFEWVQGFCQDPTVTMSGVSLFTIAAQAECVAATVRSVKASCESGRVPALPEFADSNARIFPACYGENEGRVIGAVFDDARVGGRCTVGSEQYSVSWKGDCKFVLGTHHTGRYCYVGNGESFYTKCKCNTVPHYLFACPFQNAPNLVTDLVGDSASGIPATSVPLASASSDLAQASSDILVPGTL